MQIKSSGIPTFWFFLRKFAFEMNLQEYLEAPEAPEAPEIPEAPEAPENNYQLSTI